MSKRLSTSVLVCALFALLLLTAAAGAQNPGAADVWDQGGAETGASNRDNTRTYGTVYDPAGNPMPKVDVWIVNDNAPAHRVRAKTRATGVYQIRNMGPLYNRDDVYGIVLRLSFKTPGYQSAEYVVPVERNEIEWLYPILWPEGEEPAADTRYVMVSGRLVNAKGKKVKGGTVAITSPDDSSLNLEIAADKAGNFQALVWDAPQRINVQATAPGAGTGERSIDLSTATRHDLVTVVTALIEL